VTLHTIAADAIFCCALLRAAEATSAKSNDVMRPRDRVAFVAAARPCSPHLPLFLSPPPPSCLTPPPRSHYSLPTSLRVLANSYRLYSSSLRGRGSGGCWAKLRSLNLLVRESCVYAFSSMTNLQYKHPAPHWGPALIICVRPLAVAVLQLRLGTITLVYNREASTLTR
jgi:hypothetical protein